MINKVLVLLAPGFEETEAIAVIDILRRANLQVTTAGLEKEYVTGSHDITIKCDTYYQDHDFSEYDCLFLPGGQPGTNNLKANHTVLELVRRFHNQNKQIAAICAAPTVLEAAGILQNKRITSYPSERHVFKDSIYCEEKVVKDGNLITSRGVGTAIDFGLELVTAWKSEKESKELAQKIIWSI